MTYPTEDNSANPCMYKEIAVPMIEQIKINNEKLAHSSDSQVTLYASYS